MKLSQQITNVQGRILAALLDHPELASAAVEQLTAETFKAADKESKEAVGFSSGFDLVADVVARGETLDPVGLVEQVGAQSSAATDALLSAQRTLSVVKWDRANFDRWCDELSQLVERLTISNATLGAAKESLGGEAVDLEALGEAVRERANKKLGANRWDKARASYLRKLKAACDPDVPAHRSVPTGWAPFDGVTRGGLPVGMVTTVALVTSGGKSLVTKQLVQNAMWPKSALPVTPTTTPAQRINKRGRTYVLVIATEEPAGTYFSRSLMDLLDVSGTELDKPHMRRDLFAEKQHVLVEFEAMCSDRLTILDVEELATYGAPRCISSIEAAVNRWAADVRERATARGEAEPALLVVVDYAQKIALPSDVRTNSEQSAMKQISTRLIDLARRADVALVCMAMLNGRIGHTTADTAGVREAEDWVLDSALVIFGDTLGKDNARKLRESATCESDRRSIEVADHTFRLLFKKGRHSGCPDDVLLRVDHDRQRITTFASGDEKFIAEHMQGRPLDWARNRLEPPAPSRKRRKKTDDAPLTLED